MSTIVCKNKKDVTALCTLLGNRDLPITVNIRKGADRSIEQNRLQRLWLQEAAEQLQDETIEEKRGYCKLNFGCKILYNENEEFAKAFDKVIRPLSYENKLMAMMIPLDMPVTRLMSTKQMKTYLDEIYIYFTALGVRLTEPNEGSL